MDFYVGKLWQFRLQLLIKEMLANVAFEDCEPQSMFCQIQETY